MRVRGIVKRDRGHFSFFSGYFDMSSTYVFDNESQGVFIWDISSKSKPQLRPPIARRAPALTYRAVAWSPDGSRLAASDENGMVEIWDTNTGASFLQLHCRSNAVGLVWTADEDGERLTTASEDGKLRVWTILPTQREPE